MKILRRYLIFSWSILDPLYFHLTRLHYINHSDESMFENIFRVRLTSYKGAELTLQDGTKIKKNDKLIKIHLHNIRLINNMKSLTNDLHKARYIYKTVQRSLPGLAVYLKEHPNNDQIKGIIGITTLNKGCSRLGFETFDIKNHIYKWIKMLPFITISKLASPTASMALLKKQQPKYICMSTDTLLSSYTFQTEHEYQPHSPDCLKNLGLLES